MYESEEALRRSTSRDRRPRSTSVGQLPEERVLLVDNEAAVEERRQKRARHWWGRLLNRFDRPDAHGGHGNLLLYLTILGAVVGLVGGWAASVSSPSKTAIELLGFPGEILLSMLRALVIPLILSSIVVGITSLGSASNTGHLSLRALLYYGLTTIVSAMFGIFWVLLIQPGSYATVPTDGTVPNAPQKTPLESVLDIVRSLFPSNLFKAAVEMNVLGIITFSIALGIVLIMMGSRGRPVIDFFDSFNEAIMRIVGLVIWCVPLGICSLIIAKLGHDGNFWAKLEQLSVFVLTVALGLAFHMFVFLAAVYAVFVRKNPFVFMSRLSQALLIALGTASSSATLPITIKCCEENAGISPRVTRFVLPLGATMNMNGTALYEAVACIFVAQALGVELSFAQIVITALTATLAAVGAAGIPEAGLVTLIMVLTAVGLPLDGIGLLFSIDWFLDRLRTTVNVFGDAIGAAIVDHCEAKKWEELPSLDTHSSGSGSGKEDEEADEEQHAAAAAARAEMMSPLVSAERVYPRYLEETTPQPSSGSIRSTIVSP